MRYEPLTLENIPYAVGLAKELMELGRFNEVGPPFDWDFTRLGLEFIRSNTNHYVRLAVDDDGVYVGGVRGYVTPFSFSPRLLGIEECWYVREGTPKRASVAMRLMYGFVNWCLDEKHAILVQTGDIAAIHSHAVDTLYRHMGFKRFGTVYMFQRT